MKKIIASMILISHVSLAFAGEPQVAEVKKGEPAPFTGILLGPNEDMSLRKQVLERDYFEKENELLKSENKILQERTDLWKKQSEELSKQLLESQDDSFWKKAAFFGLGALATVGLAYAVRGATK
jgi:cell shape-determining protein MreC